MSRVTLSQKEIQAECLDIAGHAILEFVDGPFFDVELTERGMTGSFDGDDAEYYLKELSRMLTTEGETLKK